MTSVIFLLLLLRIIESVPQQQPFQNKIYPHIKFEPFLMPPPGRLEGPLAPNAILDNAELVWDNGAYVGPESTAFRGDETYTGTADGFIVRINRNGTWERIVQTGTPCAGPWESHICGRPLGLRFDPKGKLIVAEAMKGLLSVDVDTRRVSTLIPRYASIGTGNEDPLNVADDLDITRDGIIYFTDVGVSTRYLVDWIVDVIADPTGRLIRYDPRTKESKVLLRGLRFANGVQLSKNEDFVVVTELGMGRAWKVHLTGNRTGQSELFVENLPGMPDNVRSNGRGGFYIALVVPRYTPNDIMGKLAPLWWARKLLVMLQRAMVKFFQFVYYSILPTEKVGAWIVYWMHFGVLGDAFSFPRQVIIVDVDEAGNIVRSLQSQKSNISYISQFDVGPEYTYLGTPFTSQLWRIRTAYLQ